MIITISEMYLVLHVIFLVFYDMFRPHMGYHQVIFLFVETTALFTCPPCSHTRQCSVQSRDQSLHSLRLFVVFVCVTIAVLLKP
jgi:hypothetical protein